MLFWQLFSSYVFVEKAAEATFIRKICTYNIDEIDGITTFNELLLLLDRPYRLQPGTETDTTELHLYTSYHLTKPDKSVKECTKN